MLVFPCRYVNKNCFLLVYYMYFISVLVLLWFIQKNLLSLIFWRLFSCPPKRLPRWKFRLFIGLQVFCADLLYFSNPSYFFEILFHFDKTLHMIILRGTVHRDSIKNLFIKISQNWHENACVKASFCRKSIL